MNCSARVILFLSLFGSSYLYSQNQVAFIDQINVMGNQKTKEEIILRELTFSTGDTLLLKSLPQVFENSKNNLLNTSLFNYVTIQEVLHNQILQVHVIVEERWYLWPYPIFEHADRNINIWLKEKEYDRLNYGIHVLKYNFRGQREVLNFKIRLGFREQYMLLYENPYLDKEKKFGLFFGVAKFRQKEIPYISEYNKIQYFTSDSYLNNEWVTDLGITYRNKWYITHGINFGFFSSEVNDTILALNDNYHANSSTKSRYFKWNYVFDYDKRDSKIYPLEGSKLLFSLEQFGFGILDSFQNAITIFKLGIQFHSPISGRWYYSNYFMSKSSLNKKPPFTRKNAIGYEDVMRGYEFYVIFGNAYYLMNNDIKYNIMPKKVFIFDYIPFSKFNKVHLSIYCDAFFDLAYVNDQDPYINDFLANKWLYSGGLGIDFVTYYDKIVRLNYAINNRNEHNFFIHFEIPF